MSGRVTAMWCGLFLAATGSLFGQTALPGGMEIRLLPGYAYEPKQGIDSIVGRIAKKDGPTIDFELGPVAPPGGLRVSGHFSNSALNVPAADRQWLKEAEIAGRKVAAVYGKDQRLYVSSVSGTEGANFHAVAKTPEEVAEVLLMTFSVAPQKAKK